MTRIAVAGATGRVGRHVVDVLTEGGHEVVAISRSNGVDVITGDGLTDARAGVRRLVVVSIIGTGKATGGYGAAKLAHEQAGLAGPDDALNYNGGLLPSPHATLTGPTFAEWLNA